MIQIKEESQLEEKVRHLTLQNNKLIAECELLTFLNAKYRQIDISNTKLLIEASKCD